MKSVICGKLIKGALWKGCSAGSDERSWKITVKDTLVKERPYLREGLRI